MTIEFTLTWMLVVRAITVLLLVVIPWALGWAAIVLYAVERVQMGVKHG